MLEIKIPGNMEYKLEHMILDFNGTIAEDGKLINGVSERIMELAKVLNIYVVTADTNGSVHNQCKNLPMEVYIIGKQSQMEEKQHFLENLHSQGTVAIGNGVNDQLMFEKADLAIGVIGAEGCAISSLIKSDIVVNHILDGLDILLKGNRLIATLRK